LLLIGRTLQFAVTSFSNSAAAASLLQQMLHALGDNCLLIAPGHTYFSYH